MKRQVLIAFVAVGIMGASCFADEPAKPAGTPKIHFDKIVYDFGATSSVSKLDGVIVVSNVGDAPLEKLQAERHCGCTTTGFKVNVLAPGEKTELPFSLTVSAAERGPLVKKISVTSSDPRQPKVDLALRVNIVIVYEANPPFLNLGNLHVSDSTNLVVQLKRIDGQPLGVAKVAGATAQVQAQLTATEGRADSATIQVQITAPGAAGIFTNAVRVFGANAEEPVLTIPVNAQLVNDLVLLPAALTWNVGEPENWPGRLGPMATTRRIVVMPFRSDQTFELSELVSSVPGLKVRLNRVAGGKHYELLAVLDKLPSESTTGTIKFATNLKTQPTVEVKVNIHIGKTS